MFRNYITAAWRNIISHKMFAVINVFGLSLGISACLIIYLIVRFELSYDNYHSDNDRIFRIVRDSYSSESGEDHSGSIPTAVPFAIRNELSGIHAVAIFHNYTATVNIPDEVLPAKKFARPLHGEEQKSDIVFAEPQYFNIFKYNWLAGNPEALKESNTVVLTESKALLYFGKLTPSQILNRTIIYDDTLIVRVAGVISDPKGNTDFFFRDFISFKTIERRLNLNSWNDSRTNEQAFVKLDRDIQPSHVNAQLATLANRHYNQSQNNKTVWLLQPLSTIHFDERYSDTYSRKVHLPTLYGLIAVGMFILSLAIINFITLSTSQSIDRAKETGIRKICGSTASGLVFRFLGETFILTVCALMLTIATIYPLFSVFKSLIPVGASFPIFTFSTWIFLLSTGVFTTIMAGLYPAKVLSSTLPTFNLKGSSMQKWNKGGYFIKGLIVFQFTISMIFITGTLITGNQIQYMLNKDLGFTKDAIITIQTNLDYDAAKKDLLAEKIRQLQAVNTVSVSEGTPIAKLHFFNPITYKGVDNKGTGCILEWGDEHFIPLYNIKIIAGRNILPSDSIKEFLVNESCSKALGFSKPEDAIGKMVETTLPPRGIISKPIVGVINDFHSQSLHEQVKPVVFTSSKEFTRLINIKLRTRNNQLRQFEATVSEIEKCWKEIYPNDPFMYSFFDETISRFYEKEKLTRKLINIAMIVSICICCLGLFGQISLTARQRTKEIGVRKVLGIGPGQIVLLLCKDSIILVLLGVVIASPIAWYGLHLWLSGFAYRIDINWWIFPLAGAIAVLIAVLSVSYQSIETALSNPVELLRNG